MKKFILGLLTLLIVQVAMAQTVYDFTVKDAQGNDISLAQYKGKALLIVNTATRCGFTPQYEELEALYEKYASKGFEILDFPCNQFGNQAPEDIEQIQSFCSLTYGTKFPQFDKIEVNGENEIPLYTFLKSQKSFAGFDMTHRLGATLDKMFSAQDPNYKENPSIKWNFTKFLVDAQGNVIKRYEPTAGAKQIEEDLCKILGI